MTHILVMLIFFSRNNVVKEHKDMKEKKSKIPAKINMFDIIKKQKHEMNLYCIKYLMFTKNSNTKLKHKIDGYINLYSFCIDCSFKKSVTIIKEELSDLLKDLI